MNQRITQLILTLFVVCGMMSFTEVKAQTNSIDNPELKGAIYNFLLESGDIGDGYTYNWQRLDLPDPSLDVNENTWWDDFFNKDYISEYQGNISLHFRYKDNYWEPLMCCGDLLLENIEKLSSVYIYTDYLEIVTIRGCEDLKLIEFKLGNYEHINPIPAIVNITNCNNLNFSSYGYGSISFAAIHELNITGCPKVSGLNINTTNTIGKILIRDSENFYGFSIDSNGSNIEEINISDNTVPFDSYNNSYNFNFSSSNVTITELPLLPSNITSLTIYCPENNFSTSPDLSYLDLKSLEFQNYNLSQFPKLAKSITELSLNFTDNNFSKPINLEYLDKLEILDLNGFCYFPILPKSIQKITCYPDYNSEKISGEINLKELTSLKELYCSNHNITKILNTPSSLEILDCYNNNISEITALNNLANLTSLSCQNNKIEGTLDLSTSSSLKILDCSYNNLTDIKVNNNADFSQGYLQIEGNRFSFPQIFKLAGGFNEISSSYYASYLPQQLTEKKVISAEEEINLSNLLVEGASFRWFDITEDFGDFLYLIEESNQMDFYYFLSGISKVDDAKINESEGKFTFSNDLKGKILLGEISESAKKNENRTYATYCLIHVEAGVKSPLLEFEMRIDDKELSISNNSTISVSWASTVELSIIPLIPEDIVYDKWEIRFNSGYNYNVSSDKIEKGSPFIFDVSGFSDILKYSVYELKLYNQNDISTYSYIETPYRITFEKDYNPVLWYEEAINEGEYQLLENNITTTLDKGNKAYLKMGVLVNPEIIPTRNTPIEDPNHSWEIEYKTKDGLMRSERLAMDEYLLFNDGKPHQEVGKYPYSVIKLFVYGEPKPVDEVYRINARSNPGERVSIYDFNDDPYNHTIIIKSDGTNPEPDPEVSMQFAVSINSNTSYKDVPNHHTTAVNNGSSVYLRISALIKDISYSSWQIDYITPTGQSATSDWVTANNPYIFNNGNPHIEKGTYVYKVNTLRLNNNGTINSFSFIQDPYINTIIIKEGDNPGPDPNPDPAPGIRISTSAKTCPDEEYVLIPFELIYTKYPLEYTIHFSLGAKAVGFVDQLNLQPLPNDKYLTIPLPKGVPAGIYKGIIRLYSNDPTQIIDDCPFEIKVLTATEIIEQPVSVTQLCPNDIFTLTVEAVGENISYQWYKDNQPIAGANTSTYEATFSDQTKGIYHVVVSGLCGVVESEKVEVSGNRLSIKMKWDDVMYVENTDNRYIAFQWYKDGLPIQKDGTAIYYTNPEGLNGVYYVKATTREGIVEESCTKVFSVSTKASSAQLYPNPVGRNENLTVSIEMDGVATHNAKIDILDISGRIVLSTRLTDAQTFIQINLTAGSYVAKIQAPDGRITTQILLVK